MKKSPIFFIALFSMVFETVHGQIQLPSFISDGMVLQQQTSAPLWGNDKPGTTVKLEGSWGESASTKTNKEGKWSAKINTPAAGGPYTLIISGSETKTLNDVMVGEVWLCSGQSNMQMEMKGLNNQPINSGNEEILYSANKNIRVFTGKRTPSTTPMDDIEGSWQSARPATTKDFSAVAYFFGKSIHKVLDVPIGLIVTSWGGSTAEAWVDDHIIEKFEGLEVAREVPEKAVQQAPTLLYNGMVHPFLPYAIKGAIWYQGESNSWRADEYQELFPALINDWRDHWGQGKFPFYFVQLAPWGYNSTNSAFLREAQLFSMQNTENTGMAVTMDIGDCENIHPPEKKKVGDRLALWALAKTYNLEGFVYSGPVYKEMKKSEDGGIVLSFEHHGIGLTSFGKELTGFTIAGSDKVFVPANARINPDKTVTVWSEKVRAPEAVRYAFDNCTAGTLFNMAGLPASSFRTDTGKQEPVENK